MNLHPRPEKPENKVIRGPSLAPFKVQGLSNVELCMPEASQNTNDLLSAIKNNLSHLYRVLQCVTILLYPHLTLKGRHS